jgi:AraC-like DNA-binding protein
MRQRAKTWNYPRFLNLTLTLTFSPFPLSFAESDDKTQTMLYLSGIILAFFLAFVLITKRDKTHADYVLAAWLAVTGFHLVTFYLFFTKQYVSHPSLVALGFPLPLAQGPFLYLYTSLQTSSVPFKKRHLLHFLPLLLSYLLFAEFHFLPFDRQVEVFMQEGRGYELQTAINSYAIYLSGIVYVPLSLIRLLKYRKSIVHQFSNTDKINFNWLLYLIIWIGAIWIIVLFVQDGTFVFTVAALFVLWLGYFGIKQVQVFSRNVPELLSEPSPAAGWDAGESNADDAEEESPGSSKYQRSTLREEDATLIYERLKHLMTEEKPFTNPDLTLNDLAKSLDVHPNHLSQVINSIENKSFYDLINEKRVEEFISLVSHPSARQYTLLGLAFDCGFNSKASFNRNFKKLTGLSPSDYLKKEVAG